MTIGDVAARGAAGETLAELASGALWQDWLTPPGAGEALPAWLDTLAAELPQRIIECRDEELRLAALWQHMVPKLGQFLPDEITHVVQAQLDAAARRGAAEALAELVRAQRTRIGDAHDCVDERTLLRLLEGIASDRVAIGRELTADVLETLCSIALDLEITERRVGDSDDQITALLADLRKHVVDAAELLRRLPSNVAVLPGAHEPASVAIGRCLSRYAATLDTHLDWRGSEPADPESASAAVWVLQELLHHLHSCMAGSATLTVTTGRRLRATLRTPSPALAPAGAEPDWLFRARLRLRLAGGSISASSDEDGSAVDIDLPAHPDVAGDGGDGAPG